MTTTIKLNEKLTQQQFVSNFNINESYPILVTNKCTLSRVTYVGGSTGYLLEMDGTESNSYHKIDADTANYILVRYIQSQGIGGCDGHFLETIAEIKKGAISNDNQTTEQLIASQTVQDALHIVLDYKAEQLQDYRKDYTGGEDEEWLKELIAYTSFIMEQLENDVIWID